MDPSANIIRLIKSGANPQQVMLNYLENNMRQTPMGTNLLQWAKQGNTAEIEKFARNYVTSQGRDFDAEFRAFRQNLGL